MSTLMGATHDHRKTYHHPARITCTILAHPPALIKLFEYDMQAEQVRTRTRCKGVQPELFQLAYQVRIHPRHH